MIYDPIFRKGIINMLAELALASAAFSTVKEFISNGKELYDCGEQLVGYFDAKNSLQKKVNQASGDKSDLEEFLALEKIKAQEDELREMMIYTGRAGMWQDWLKFQSEAAQRREEQRKEAMRAKLKKQEDMVMYLEIGAGVAAAGVGLALVAWVLYKFVI
jgi:hypothetical protein